MSLADTQQHAALDAAPRPDAAASSPAAQRPAAPSDERPPQPDGVPGAPAKDQSPWFNAPQQVDYHGGYNPQEQYEQWYAEQQQAKQYEEQYLREPPTIEPSPPETRSPPTTGEDVAAFIVAFHKRESAGPQPPVQGAPDPVEQPTEDLFPVVTDTQATPASSPSQTAQDPHGPQVDAPVDEPPQPPSEPDSLTAPDRYYLAWMGYQHLKGNEPSDEQLSAYCAEKGLLGRSGKPLSPANLRRHFVRWRIYNTWAQHREHTLTPGPTEVAQACADRGITAQYNRPVTPAHITQEANDFERRWQTLIRHHNQTP